jgi:hypothetical protein
MHHNPVVRMGRRQPEDVSTQFGYFTNLIDSKSHFLIAVRKIQGSHTAAL